MTDSAVPPVANRAGRLSAVAEWQMLHGLAARDGERGDHGELLAWRQGMHGPALVTSRPRAARGALPAPSSLATAGAHRTSAPAGGLHRHGLAVASRVVQWPLEG